MYRIQHCRVCNGEDFKRVVTTLPSGRERITDLKYCDGCRLVVYEPAEDTFLREMSKPNLRPQVPVEVVEAIKRALPDPATHRGRDDLIEVYQHAELGRVGLIFRRLQKLPNDDGSPGAFVWHFEDVKLLG